MFGSVDCNISSHQIPKPTKYQIPPNTEFFVGRNKTCPAGLSVMSSGGNLQFNCKANAASSDIPAIYYNTFSNQVPIAKAAWSDKYSGHFPYSKVSKNSKTTKSLQIMTFQGIW